MRVIFIKKQNLINLAILFVVGIVALVAGVMGNRVNGIAETSAGINAGDRESNAVALMFGVDGGGKYIDNVLATLAENEVQATFFVSGVWVLNNNEDFVKLAESGNEVGNHGYFGKNHKQISEEENRDEIRWTHSAIKRASGIEAKLFLAPNSLSGKATVDAAATLNYKVVQSSQKIKNIKKENAQAIYKRATKNNRAGDLIMLNMSEETMNVLDAIIKAIKGSGLEIKVVGEIVK